MQLTLTQLFAKKYDSHELASYDRVLLLVAMALMTYGIVMVASASMAEGIAKYNNPYFFIIRHMIFAVLAIIVMLTTVLIPINQWHKHSGWLLALSVVLLISVLLVGRSVNGATRWLSVGPINIQAAEPAKLFFFAFLSSYLVRRNEQLQESWKGIAKPIFMLFIMAALLAMQPDLGTIIVILVTSFAVLFLGGANVKHFFGLVIGGLIFVVLMIISEEYRMRRIEAFLDPWADPFGTGYQLTQSLMAFGRGDWFGQGLGNSLQKLQFLPEAHTDFIVAIIGEELGFVGIAVLLALLLVLITKAMLIGNKCLQANMPYHGYFAYTIGIWFCFQTLVNIGASTGMVPTKGLTLPLVSYGGSSLLVMAMAVAALLRMDYEYRIQEHKQEQTDA